MCSAFSTNEVGQVLFYQFQFDISLCLTVLQTNTESGNTRFQLQGRREWQMQGETKVEPLAVSPCIIEKRFQPMAETCNLSNVIAISFQKYDFNRTTGVPQIILSIIITSISFAWLTKLSFQ